ncbi:Odorant receptor 377, partial [Nylanderia fulva]
VRNLFSLMEYHWKVFNNFTDVKILENYVIFTRKVVVFYATYVYVSTSLYLIMPMTPQIMDLVMPLNESRPRKSEKYYYFILFHSYVAIVTLMSIVVCVDTTYIAYLKHGCSLFAAIGHRLEHIVTREFSQTSYLKRNKERTYDMEDIDDIDFKERIFRELIICLKKHQLALEYTHILESSFMLSTGIQLACNMLAMSLSLIQVVSNLDDIKDSIRYSCMCLGEFFHLLCMSLPGQRLMDHSINKSFSCRSHWYTFSLKSKKLLWILLYRSTLYVNHRENIHNIVQSAMSYYMTFSSLK